MKTASMDNVEKYVESVQNIDLGFKDQKNPDDISDHYNSRKNQDPVWNQAITYDDNAYENNSQSLMSKNSALMSGLAAGGRAVGAAALSAGKKALGQAGKKSLGIMGNAGKGLAMDPAGNALSVAATVNPENNKILAANMAFGAGGAAKGIASKANQLGNKLR
jgi:hypothetical protein